MTFAPARPGPTQHARLWTPGESLAWMSAIVFTLSPFLGWYTGTLDGLRLSVVGWDTGAIGKLVLLVGVATLVLLGLRAAGFEPPPTVPFGMVIAALGAIGTVFMLIRVASIPDDYVELGRAIGLWISLVAAVLLIVAGLLKSAEDA
jgi:hypothetical protein